MNKRKSLFFFLIFFLLSIFMVNIHASDTIEITRIGVKNDTDLVIYWERLVDMSGYNVRFIDKYDKVVETAIVDKSFNFAEIEDYVDKRISKIEVIGVRNNNTTVTAGKKLTFYNNKPLDVNKVILGAYEEDSYLYPVFNPDLNYTSAKIIKNGNEAKLMNGRVKITLNGDYTVLAELKLVDGVSVYGTYSGEKVNIETYNPKVESCIMQNRRIVEGKIEERVIQVPIESQPLIMYREIVDNFQTINYFLDIPDNFIVLSFYDDRFNFIASEEIYAINPGWFSSYLYPNTYFVEILHNKGIEYDSFIDSRGRFQPIFTPEQLYEEKIETIKHDDEIEYILNISGNVAMDFYNDKNQLIDTRTVSPQGGIYKTSLLTETSYIVIKTLQESYKDVIKDSNGQYVSFNLTEEHLQNHQGENVLQGAVSHQATETSEKPYSKLMLQLGPQTIMDMVVNGETVYKQMTDGDMKELYIPLNKGSNTVSVVVYTRDGKSEAKSFIVNYQENIDSDIEKILNSDPYIAFDSDYNGKTLEKNSVSFSGTVYGGDILLVNGVSIDLSIDMKFAFKVNLAPGDNRIVFTINNGENVVYSETVLVKYVVPDLITNVNSISEINKQYKETPTEESARPIEKKEEIIPPTYDEVLSDDFTDFYKFAGMGIAIIFLFLVIILQAINRGKYEYYDEESDSWMSEKQLRKLKKRRKQQERKALIKQKKKEQKEVRKKKKLEKRMMEKD